MDDFYLRNRVRELMQEKADIGGQYYTDDEYEDFSENEYSDEYEGFGINNKNWMDFASNYYSQHPRMTWQNAIKKAAKLYRKEGKAITKRRKRRRTTTRNPRKKKMTTRKKTTKKSKTRKQTRAELHKKRSERSKLAYTKNPFFECATQVRKANPNRKISSQLIKDKHYCELNKKCYLDPNDKIKYCVAEEAVQTPTQTEVQQTKTRTKLPNAPAPVKNSFYDFFYSILEDIEDYYDGYKDGFEYKFLVMYINFLIENYQPIKLSKAGKDMIGYAFDKFIRVMVTGKKKI